MDENSCWQLATMKGMISPFLHVCHGFSLYTGANSHNSVLANATGHLVAKA
jgi:hypothetical protein